MIPAAATKLSQSGLPIGRAAAQPRVNLQSHYSPNLSFSGSTEDCASPSTNEDELALSKSSAGLYASPVS